jgi:hypothetical protein
MIPNYSGCGEMIRLYLAVIHSDNFKKIILQGMIIWLLENKLLLAFKAGYGLEDTSDELFVGTSSLEHLMGIIL